MAILPRGIRNNNPLNLRKSSSAWLGKIQNGTDPAFEQFVTMQHGIRAAILNARTHARRRGQLSVEQLITLWAPASDGNNTKAYIQRVCLTANVKPTTVIDFKNKPQITEIFHSMAYVECGKWIDLKYFNEAFDML